MPPKKISLIRKCPCGYCHESTSGSAAVQCSQCEFWHHISCVPGMSEEIYKHLVAAKEAAMSIKWSCEKCEKTTKKMESLITVLGRRMDDLEERAEKTDEMVKVLTGEVGALKKKLQ